MTDQAAVDYTCPDAPKAPGAIINADGTLNVDQATKFMAKLRVAYDNCEDQDHKLVSMATRVPADPQAAPLTPAAH